MRLERRKHINAGAIPAMPKQGCLGPNPTRLSPVTGDNDSITDEDTRRTIAEIMGAGARENRLELLDETIKNTGQLCSLGIRMRNALHLV